MKNKKQFLVSINTLMYSWGSEAPAEVIWGLNELLDWLEDEYNMHIPMRFQEDNVDNKNEELIQYLEDNLI
jgi:hypothetical protein